MSIQQQLLRAAGGVALGGGGPSYRSIAGSGRFEDDADYLSEGFVSAGDDTTWSIAYWARRMEFGAIATVASAYVGDSNGRLQAFIGWESGDRPIYNSADAAGNSTGTCQSDTAIADSLWHHYLWVYDSANGTSTDRIRLYVDGVRQGTSSYTAPTVHRFMDSAIHYIASRQYSGGVIRCSAWLADFIIVDGTALDPSTLGDSSSGSWRTYDPAAVISSWGTNGLYLKGEDVTAGTDSSSNANDWTLNDGVSSDATPTSDPALDPAYNTGTLSNGNLTFDTTGGEAALGFLPIPPKGKWYFEVDAETVGVAYVGVALRTHALGPAANDDHRVYRKNNIYYDDVGNHAAGFGSGWGSGALIGVAVDSDAGKIWFSKSGTFDGDPAAGTGEAFADLGSDVWHPIVCGTFNPSTLHAVFKTADLTYSPPTGFQPMA